jgi:hypothetical protein
MRETEKQSARVTEQRAHPRRASSRKVYLVSGRLATKCALIDIAVGGARIRLAGGALPPGDLSLIDSRARRVHLVRAVWQSEREAGLQFIETETLDHPAGGVDGAARAALMFGVRLARAGRLTEP